MLLLLVSIWIELLLRSQWVEVEVGEVGGEVELGEAEVEAADEQLATEEQLPVFLDKSVGSFSF